MADPTPEPAAAPPPRRHQRAVAAVRARPWAAAAVLAAGLLGVLHLVALGSAPPGLYNDEASIGYNAWAVAHHGVDEHGAAHPLLFEAFGEWKGPISMYLVAPLTWLFPLTPALVRLPSALCGLGIAAISGLTAWRLTGSRPVGVLMLLTAGLEPWLFLDSRTDMEAIVPVVLCLCVAVWCCARARPQGSWRWFAGAGVAIGVGLYGYTPERLFAAGLTVLILVCFLFGTRAYRACLAVLPPVTAAYGLLLWWGSRHPGALTGRFNVLSIGFDNPGLASEAARFVANYVDYFGAPFLLTHGDGNLRHSTGFGGMLFVVTAPALLAGVVACVRRLDQPMARLALLGTLAAPVPAALTADGTPHSLRASSMLPFLLLLMTYGWDALAPWLGSRRGLALALAAGAAIECGGYLDDLFLFYPGRAAPWFDSGEAEAIALAHDAAAGHRVLLSDSLDEPYIQALFVLRPDPGAYHRDGLAAVGMEVVHRDDLQATAGPGDILVLAPSDPPPPGAVRIATETATVRRSALQVGAPEAVVEPLVVVYRVGPAGG